MCYRSVGAGVEVREFLDASGRSRGNFSNVEAVGSGVSELKINFRPGYRVYFGQDGDQIVILLGGSTKKRQGTAIASAHATWAEYKRSKSEVVKWH